jgi:hypothetical protein
MHPVEIDARRCTINKGKMRAQYILRDAPSCTRAAMSPLRFLSRAITCYGQLVVSICDALRLTRIALNWKRSAQRAFLHCNDSLFWEHSNGDAPLPSGFYSNNSQPSPWHGKIQSNGAQQYLPDNECSQPHCGCQVCLSRYTGILRSMAASAQRFSSSQQYLSWMYSFHA